MKMTFEVRLDWILRLSQVSFIWLVLRKGNGPVYVCSNSLMTKPDGNAVDTINN